VTDHPGDAAAHGEADFRELGRLAAAGLATNDDNLVVIDDGREFLALVGDGEVFGERDGGEGCLPLPAEGGGEGNLVPQAGEGGGIGGAQSLREAAEAGLIAEKSGGDEGV
jgi:hypothetical protein